MSKARLVITAIEVEGRSPAEVIAAYGVSRSWLYELLKRYRTEGDAAFEPRPGGRGPHLDQPRRRRWSWSCDCANSWPIPGLMPARTPSAGTWPTATSSPSPAPPSTGSSPGLAR